MTELQDWTLGLDSERSVLHGWCCSSPPAAALPCPSPLAAAGASHIPPPHPHCCMGDGLDRGGTRGERNVHLTGVLGVNSATSGVGDVLLCRQLLTCRR